MQTGGNTYRIPLFLEKGHTFLEVGQRLPIITSVAGDMAQIVE
jgi:hypothetical protein